MTGFRPTWAPVRARSGPSRGPGPGSSRRRGPRERSEEHTSELQSRLHLVCRLLLEKKKKKDPVRSLVSTAEVQDIPRIRPGFLNGQRPGAQLAVRPKYVLSVTEHRRC